MAKKGMQKAVSAKKARVTEAEVTHGYRTLTPAPASPPTPTAHERLSHLF